MRTLFPRLRSLLLLLTLLTGCGQALPTPEVPQASASQAQQAVYTTPVTPSTKASLEKEKTEGVRLIFVKDIREAISCIAG